MKLFLDYCKKCITNWLIKLICGSSLTNTVIRNRITKHFIKRIYMKSLWGNKSTNALLYDTMFIVHIPDPVYETIKDELIAIVYYTVLELEYILKNKVNSNKFPNVNNPHSPYWQFVFQNAPIDSKVGDAIVKEDFFEIKSTTFPAGRDQNTKDEGGPVSIKSLRSRGGDTYINMDAFDGVKRLCEGEFVVPFGMLKLRNAASNKSQSVYLTLSVTNSSFLVNGKMTDTYNMTTNEIYITGKNASDFYKEVPTLRIANSHVMTPQVHVTYLGGDVFVKATGDVTFLNNRINDRDVRIPRGSVIVINRNILIEIK